jgi:hypothetical protein
LILLHRLVESGPDSKEEGGSKSAMSQMDMQKAINEAMHQHGMSSSHLKISFNEEQKCLIPPMLV